MNIPTKLLIGMALAVTSTYSFAGVINDQCPQLTANGTPAYQPLPGDQEICHANYAVIHRCEDKAPVAVFEHLTKEDITGPAKRKDNFHPDVSVSPGCSATLADYATVGKTHDRGHLSPAGNNTQSVEVMSESFDLSNMIAQVANNNRGIWKQVETVERQQVSIPGTDYYIISGGIFDQGHPVTGNGLGIPTRLYKIIIEKNSKKVQAYLMPNTALPVKDLPKYEVPITAVEHATQMKFNLGL